MLQANIYRPGRIGRWTVDESLDTASWQPKPRVTGVIASVAAAVLGAVLLRVPKAVTTTASFAIEALSLA